MRLLYDPVTRGPAYPFLELCRYFASPAEFGREHLAVRAENHLTSVWFAKDGKTVRVELKRIKLTDHFVKSATTGGPRSPIFMDDGVIGFGVQIRDTGRKSVTLDYAFESRRRRLYIGDFPIRSS